MSKPSFGVSCPFRVYTASVASERFFPENDPGGQSPKAAADAPAKSATDTARKRACERRKRYRLHNIAISDQSSKHKSEGFASYSPWARCPCRFTGPFNGAGRPRQRAGTGQQIDATTRKTHFY